jgi:hypothetical protein
MVSVWPLNTNHLMHRRQRAFETAISDMAEEFIGATANEADTITTRLEPEIQSRRALLLLQAEEILDSFQVKHDLWSKISAS